MRRWSRRKRQAAADAASRPPRGKDDGTEKIRAEVAAQPPPALPSIESIDPASDIAKFLAPGVPTAVTQAALRGAWKADPAIRDFVGLCENAWDFTAADGVPGFGPLAAEDVRRLVSRVLDEEAALEGPVAAPAPSEPTPRAVNDDGVFEEPAAALPPTVPATVEANGPPQSGDTRSRRRHGGALPR